MTETGGFPPENFGACLPIKCIRTKMPRPAAKTGQKPPSKLSRQQTDDLDRPETGETAGQDSFPQANIATWQALVTLGIPSPGQIFHRANQPFQPQIHGCIHVTGTDFPPISFG